MSWGTRRRNSIIMIFLLAVTIPASIILFNIYYEPANCFDNKQNGVEQGVDCGGTCLLLCQNLVIEPIVVWQRFFEVSPGVYNVAALVENPNPDAGVKDAQYVFKLYDDANLLLYERKGSANLRPKELLPIIENTLFTNKLEAKRLSFEFTNDFVYSKEGSRERVIIIKDEALTEEDTEPRIDASIQNIDVLPVRDIMVVVIVYGANDNAIAISSTVVDEVVKDGVRALVFTWPKPFTEAVSRIEIIPLYENSEL